MIFTSLIGKYKNTAHLVNSLIQVVINKYPARRLNVIGITGTDGKTTTSHLVYEMLKRAGKSVALLSTVAAFLDGETLDTGYHVTTPDPKFLQPLIKRITDKGVKYLVLEATSHGLDQHRVLGCNFKIGVLTNLTHEHLDYHGSFEKYRKAKAKLFKKVDYAILNKDDLSYNYFRELLKEGAKEVNYSLGKAASLKASNIKSTPKGTSFIIIEDEKKYSFSTRLVGKYNVSNILAACGVARIVGISWSKISLAIQNFQGVEGRMERIDGKKEFTVIVDFAHTPNALENVLKTLRRLKPKRGRLIAVFGCAGERDIKKRPMMADISTRLADVTIFTAEDPRHEDVNKIIEEMVNGVQNDKAIEVKKIQAFSKTINRNIFLREPDRKKAINLAIRQIAKKGDIVLIAGKGHEKSMAIGDKEIPWSDHRTIKAALEGRF